MKRKKDLISGLSKEEQELYRIKKSFKNSGGNSRLLVSEMKARFSQPKLLYYMYGQSIV